ncbi:MAG: homoserine dehydrogenase [Clostridiales bacterium]|nr:homoserine dehydrogenase [Clostridiales bacterium]
METINIAILGLGTVGQGVAIMLLKYEEFLERQLGCKIVLKRILEKDWQKELDFDKGDIPLSDNWQDVLTDPDIQIVIETMGGIEPAKTFIREALQSGKNVVTANKDLLALHGQELFGIAEEAGTDLYFEASVGGAIPILCALRQNLISDPIREVMGIVNGTTNYILSRMTDQGDDFSSVLADAQKLGFAEANPASDVEGLDAGRKAAILSTLAFQSQVTLDDVYIEGITGITREDILFADQMDLCIKLVALCRETDGKIEVRVHPALLPKAHPLSSVKEAYNAVFVKADRLGEVMLYGRGAGRFPTASAILGDVAEIVRNIRFGSCGSLTRVYQREKAILPIEDVETRFFLRLLLTDRPGVLATVARILGRYQVSLDTVNQIDLIGGNAELIFVTHLVREGDLRKALEEIRGLEITKEVITVLRVEGVA